MQKKHTAVLEILSPETLGQYVLSPPNEMEMFNIAVAQYEIYPILCFSSVFITTYMRITIIAFVIQNVLFIIDYISIKYGII